MSACAPMMAVSSVWQRGGEIWGEKEYFHGADRAARAQADLREALFERRDADETDDDAGEHSRRLCDAMQELDLDDDGGISLDELILYGLGDSRLHQSTDVETPRRGGEGGDEQWSEIIGDLATQLTTRLDQGSTVAIEDTQSLEFDASGPWRLEGSRDESGGAPRPAAAVR